MRIRWRGLELPSQVMCDTATLTPTYGKFVAEPFERGFGVTIGNSLRRIMLSSLEGSAITRIKLHSAQHEFTTLPGVVEDVTDIVLNVKSLIVKNSSAQTRVLRIEKNTKGAVTGADIRTDEAVEVLEIHCLEFDYAEYLRDIRGSVEKIHIIRETKEQRERRLTEMYAKFWNRDLSLDQITSQKIDNSQEHFR